jgi:uncharacterized protein (DUF58 family)
MSRFGASTEPVPSRIDELISGALMSKLERLDLVSRKIFSGKIHGERRSRRRGTSVDFADYRPYSPGDDLRFVDWNIYARLDALFLKLFLEEEDLALGIVIDTSASMDWGNPNKLNFCRRLAMALGYIGLVNHNRVSMHGFDGRGLSSLRMLRGKRRTRELGTWLLDLQAGTPEDAGGFESAMKTLALSRRGRGVLIVLSDFMEPDGIDAGLRLLGGRGDEVICLQVLAPEEVDPAGCGLSGDLRLQDIEGYGDVEITVTPALLRSYKERLDSYCMRLRTDCVRRGMRHLAVHTSTDLESILVETMRQQGMIR